MIKLDYSSVGNQRFQDWLPNKEVCEKLQRQCLHVTEYKIKLYSNVRTLMRRAVL